MSRRPPPGTRVESEGRDEASSLVRSIYDDYVHGVVAPAQRRLTEHLESGLWQIPRILVGAMLVTMICALAWPTVRALVERRPVLGVVFEQLPLALWLIGVLVLLVELASLTFREAAAQPWPGTPPTTFSIFLRAFGSFVLSSVLELRFWSEHPIAGPGLAVVGVLLLGWNLPAALRGWRAATRALRSLAIREAPALLATLRSDSARAGRRLVLGQLRWQKLGRLELEHEGQHARLVEPEPELMVLSGTATSGGVIAQVHLDGDAYRGGGVRLESGGLPIWVLAAEQATPDHLARLRRRLRAAALLDAALLAGPVIGALMIVVLFVLAAR